MDQCKYLHKHVITAMASKLSVFYKWLKVEMQKAPNVKYCWQSFCKNIDHFKQCNKLKTVGDVTFSCIEHVKKYFLCLLIAI